MPDLIGTLGVRAADILRAPGLPGGRRGRGRLSRPAARRRASQTPQAGFQIATGEPITLEVSR